MNTEPKTMNCQQALDLLAVALADHNHQWTDEQREAYESTIGNIEQWRECAAKAIPFVRRYAVHMEECGHDSSEARSAIETFERLCLCQLKY